MLKSSFLEKLVKKTKPIKNKENDGNKNSKYNESPADAGADNSEVIDVEPLAPAEDWTDEMVGEVGDNAMTKSNPFTKADMKNNNAAYNEFNSVADNAIGSTGAIYDHGTISLILDTLIGKTVQPAIRVIWYLFINIKHLNEQKRFYLEKCNIKITSSDNTGISKWRIKWWKTDDDADDVDDSIIDPDGIEVYEAGQSTVGIKVQPPTVSITMDNEPRKFQFGQKKGGGLKNTHIIKHNTPRVLRPSKTRQNRTRKSSITARNNNSNKRVLATPRRQVSRV